MAKLPRVPFKNIFPTRTAGRRFQGRDKKPVLGTHSDGRESKYISCIQCGWPVDTDDRSPGDGYEGNGTLSTTTDSNGQVTGDLADDGAGCPNCLSSNFDGKARRVRSRKS